jgi:O-antigen/teichoic acid export membrane protein
MSTKTLTMLLVFYFSAVQLEPSVVSEMFILLSVTVISVLLIDFGYQLSIPRDIGVHGKNAVFSLGIAVKLILTPISFVLFFGIFFMLDGDIPVEDASLIFISALAYSFAEFNCFILRALNLSSREAFACALYFITTLGLFVFSIEIVLELSFIVYILLAAKVSYLILSFALLPKDIKFSFNNPLLIFGELRKNLKYFLESATSVVSNNYDVILLAFFIPVALLAPYQANQKIYSALVPVIQVAFIAHYTRMSENASGEVRRFNRTMYFITFCSAIFFALSGFFIVGEVFGNDFLVSIPVLCTLTLMLVSRFLLARIGVVLTASGVQGLKNMIMILLLFFQILLSYCVLMVKPTVLLFIVISTSLNFLAYFYLVYINEKNNSIGSLEGFPVK